MSTVKTTLSPDQQPSTAQFGHFLAPSEVPVAAKQAIEAYGHGDWATAEQLCRMVLLAQPDYFGALNVLGAITAQTKRPEEAARLFGNAVAARPGNAAAHNNYGNALQELKQADAAIASYDRAIAIKPDYAEAHNNRGAALQALGQLDAAIAGYERAIAIKPDYAEAYGNRGNALRELKQFEAAVASYDRAIAIGPADADVHYYRGVTLQAHRRLDASIASYKHAIAIKPEFTEAHISLGDVLKISGRLAEAEASFRKALATAPDSTAVKAAYADCVSAMEFLDFDRFIYATTAQAIAEAWIRPLNLSKPACNLLKLHLRKKGILTPRSVFEQQTRPQSNPVDLAAPALLDADVLLHALLGTTPVVDAELEDFLTAVRRGCLEKAAGTKDPDNESLQRPGFYCSLAKQCFINEYVFYCSSGELETADKLKNLLIDSLGNRREVTALLVVAVACYFPLYTLAGSERLLEQAWPGEISSLLAMQIKEPLEEQRLRSSIPQLTDAEDEVSRAVQNQYEENPYPRWIKVPPVKLKQSIAAYFRNWFPFAEMPELESMQQPEILIAGCGTGQHPIDTAQSILGSNVLAIDLSTSSLAYAKRKTLELNIDSIEYAQADILKLDTLGRSFDVIEASGVLHHLADPLQGWRELLSLLRPNGFMKLGFYSEIARRDIVRARDLISVKGYGSTPHEIRECRQYLRQIEKTENLGSVLQGDFFSISNCRDWLFHVQEHRMTLDGIADFLQENELSFLGFQFDPAGLRAYELRFPGDRAGTNLHQWKIFEHENPDTFGGMYQFWIQKKPRGLSPTAV